MLIDRLLDYVRYDTKSSEASPSFPSSEGQWLLARHLLEELEGLGLEKTLIDEYCYVYGYLPGDEEYLSVGLVAHMDTSEQASGTGVKPRVIENYDGKDIRLNDDIVTTVERFPLLKKYEGKTLIVTDGNTLLGADDKAGIACIMEVLEYYANNPDVRHGPIWVCFTPDEEVGRGTLHFNYELFDVDFAYTIDGGDPDCIEYENFNAASATVEISGISVHPGDAKDKMVNALQVAHEFHSLLDPDAVPEKTEGYQGFNMLLELSGEVGQARMSYIIRNHDALLLEKQKQDFLDIGKKLNERYGYEAVKVEVRDSYRNMKEKFAGHMEPIELVRKAMENIGIEYREVAIRGGTDGAVLTWNGILCPNLGTGGHSFHGIHEFWCLEEGQQAVELIREILSLAKRDA